MRTIALALGVILSVACGAILVGTETPFLVGLIAALLLGLAAWLGLSLGGRDRASARPRLEAQLAIGLSLTLGLVRGATTPPDEPVRAAARGAPALGRGRSVYELEVVGASEPGVRCVLELRDPTASWASPPLRVSAPPEQCPRAAGERVAVPERSLAATWRDSLLGSGTHDLGLGPVLWSRRSPPTRGLARVRVRYWQMVARLRQRAWVSTRGDPSASLVVAVGLGLRSALAPEQREQLRAAGLGHLIAVSGLHVAVAALGLQALARRVVVLLGAAPGWACLIAWLPLWGYVGLTGGAASAIRAAVMLTAIDLSVVVGRPRHGPTLLALTAAGMLLWCPRWVFDPGFALSIAAMAAIVTAPRELGTLALSWRITWATAPISLACFDTAPLHGLIGNSVALPIFALLMPVALVAVLAPGDVGALALELGRRCATPILDLAAVLAELPSAGPVAMSLLAGLGLVVHLVRARARARARARFGTGDRFGEPDPASPVWLPPRLALALGLLVGLVQLGTRAEPGQPEFDWVALGTVHSRSLLIADRSAPGSACWYRPTDSSATWRALFELLELRSLTRVSTQLPEHASSSSFSSFSTRFDPNTRALLDRLGETPFEPSPRADCEAPTPERVRAALRACQYRQGGRGRALVRSQAGFIWCRIADRWVLAQELGLSNQTSTSG